VDGTYAIIRDSGREHRVAEGERILVDLRDVEVGAEVTFPEVVFLRAGKAVRVGRPHVEGASVVGEVTRTVAMKKLYPYQFKRRKGQHRKIGHRQKMLEVEIRSIQA
jgi:large subunit ribosomal protein L21